MNTLCNDLIDVLSKHLDASEIVLSISKTLEIEDAEESTYNRECWPWILYDLKHRIDQYIAIGICRDDDKYKLLNYIEISRYTLINNVGYYNKQKVLNYCLERYQSDIDKCYIINAAIIGGHFELYERLKSSTDSWHFIVVCGYHLPINVFENGNSEFIKRFDIQIDRKAFLGAVRGNHLDLVKQITRLYKYKIKTKDLNLIFNKDRDNFDVVKYLVDIGRINIRSNMVLLKYLKKSYYSSRIIEFLVKQFGTLLRKRGRFVIIMQCISGGYIESAKHLMKDYEKEIIPYCVGLRLKELQDIGCRKLVNEYSIL